MYGFKNIWAIMVLIAIAMSDVHLHAQLIDDKPTKAQQDMLDKLRKPITVRFFNFSPKTAVLAIQKEVGIDLRYDEGVLNLGRVNKNVRLNMILKNVPASRALELVLQSIARPDTPLYYEVHSNYISAPSMKSFSASNTRRYYDLKPIIDSLIDREVKVMGEDERQEIDRSDYAEKIVEHVLLLLDPTGILKRKNKISVGVIGERMSVKMDFLQQKKVSEIMRLFSSIAEHGRIDYQGEFETVLSKMSLSKLERIMNINSVKSTPWLKAHFDVRKQSAMNVVADWPTLKEIGVTDESATWHRMDLNGIPIRKALWLMLASVRNVKEPLDYIIDEHGIVVITSFEKTLLKNRIYAYDVKNILDLPASAKGRSSLIHDSEKSAGEIAKVFNMLLDEKVTVGQIEKREYLAGSLIEADGYLITNTTPTNHRIIQRVLRVISDASNNVQDLKINRKTYINSIAALKSKYDFEIEDKKWESAVHEVMEGMGFYNVFINWQAIETAGLKLDDLKISINHKDKTGEFILSDLMDKASDPDKAMIDYFIDRDGMVYISTVDDLSRRRMLRLYDVRDLVIKATETDSKKDDAKDKGTFKIQQIVERIQEELKQAIADNNKVDYKIAQTHGLIAFHGVFNQHRLVEETISKLRESQTKQ